MLTTIDRRKLGPLRGESKERNQQAGTAGKKDEKDSDAPNTEAHVVTIADVPSLERFQVDPNGNSQLMKASS